MGICKELISLFSIKGVPVANFYFKRIRFIRAGCQQKKARLQTDVLLCFLPNFIHQYFLQFKFAYDEYSNYKKDTRRP